MVCSILENLTGKKTVQFDFNLRGFLKKKKGPSQINPNVECILC